MLSIFEQEEMYRKSIDYFTQKGRVKETALDRLYHRDTFPILGDITCYHGSFVDSPCDVLIPPLLRKESPQNMRKGIWKRRDYGRALFDKTIGIIGLGNIGKIIAKIAKCLGMKIFAINR